MDAPGGESDMAVNLDRISGHCDDGCMDKRWESETCQYFVLDRMGCIFRNIVLEIPQKNKISYCWGLIFMLH